MQAMVPEKVFDVWPIHGQVKGAPSFAKGKQAVEILLLTGRHWTNLLFMEIPNSDIEWQRSASLEPCCKDVDRWIRPSDCEGQSRPERGYVIGHVPPMPANVG